MFGVLVLFCSFFSVFFASGSKEKQRKFDKKKNVGRKKRSCSVDNSNSKNVKQGKGMRNLDFRNWISNRNSDIINDFFGGNSKSKDVGQKRRMSEDDLFTYGGVNNDHSNRNNNKNKGNVKDEFLNSVFVSSKVWDKCFTFMINNNICFKKFLEDYSTFNEGTKKNFLDVNYFLQNKVIERDSEMLSGFMYLEHFSRKELFYLFNSLYFGWVFPFEELVDRNPFVVEFFRLIKLRIDNDKQNMFNFEDDKGRKYSKILKILDLSLFDNLDLSLNHDFLELKVESDEEDNNRNFNESLFLKKFIYMKDFEKVRRNSLILSRKSCGSANLKPFFVENNSNNNGDEVKVDLNLFDLKEYNYFVLNKDIIENEICFLRKSYDELVIKLDFLFGLKSEKGCGFPKFALLKDLPKYFSLFFNRTVFKDHFEDLLKDFKCALSVMVGNELKFEIVLNCLNEEDETDFRYEASLKFDFDTLLRQKFPLYYKYLNNNNNFSEQQEILVLKGKTIVEIACKERALKRSKLYSSSLSQIDNGIASGVAMVSQISKSEVVNNVVDSTKNTFFFFKSLANSMMHSKVESEELYK